MKTQKEVRNSFWEFLKEVNSNLAAQRRSKKSQNDYCTDIRVKFVDYVDYLHRDGQINDKLANRVTL